MLGWFLAKINFQVVFLVAFSVKTLFGEYTWVILCELGANCPTSPRTDMEIVVGTAGMLAEPFRHE